MNSISRRDPSRQKTVILEPLTRDAFTPYGLVLEIGTTPVAANGDTAWRHDIGEVVAHGRGNSHLQTSVFECEPQSLPLLMTFLERHPYSAQTITPIQSDEYVTVVCGSDVEGMPDLLSLHAFRARPDQGINYHPGVWHHGIIALNRRSLFFVQSWQDGTDLDCEIQALEPISLLA